MSKDFRPLWGNWACSLTARATELVGKVEVRVLPCPPNFREENRAVRPHAARVIQSDFGSRIKTHN